MDAWTFFLRDPLFAEKKLNFRGGTSHTVMFRIAGYFITTLLPFRGLFSLEEVPVQRGGAQTEQGRRDVLAAESAAQWSSSRY
jgi:hypothetical protein